MLSVTQLNKLDSQRVNDMSNLSELDWMMVEAEDLIGQGTPVNEAIDAVVLTNDLTAGEKRNLIHMLAKAGFKGE